VIKNVANAIKFSNKCQGFGGAAMSVIIMFAGSAKDIKRMCAHFPTFCNSKSSTQISNSKKK
jgi:hypothetical protein